MALYSTLCIFKVSSTHIHTEWVHIPICNNCEYIKDVGYNVHMHTNVGDRSISVIVLTLSFTTTSRCYEKDKYI